MSIDIQEISITKLIALSALYNSPPNNCINILFAEYHN